MQILSATVISRFPNDMIRLIHVHLGHNDEPSSWYLGYLCRQTAPWWRVGIKNHLWDCWEGSHKFPCCYWILFRLWAVRYWTWALLCDHEFHSQNGYHNVRCVRKSHNWRNRNFDPKFIKNSHVSKFQNWSTDSAFGNSCHDLGNMYSPPPPPPPGIEE